MFYPVLNDLNTFLWYLGTGIFLILLAAWRR